MKNLEQIRAAKALAAAERTSKQAVSKLPGLILANGLLAAAAFAEEKGGNLKTAMDAVADHLAAPVHGIDVLSGVSAADDLVKRLSVVHQNLRPTAFDLQRATLEALAFLGYLKRFTTKSESTTPDPVEAVV